MTDLQKVAIVIDYQNVHMTARDVFMPNDPIHFALIDPVKYAKRLIQVKNDDIKFSRAEKGLTLPDCQLACIEVFRGIPVAEADPDGYRRNLKQKSTWEREACLNHLDLHITYRPLKYRSRMLNGESRIDTSYPPQEIGVDVLCALAVTRLARSGDYDCVILASRDTDLIPALDEAHQTQTKTRIEAAKWFSPTVAFTRGALHVDKSWKLWTTSMDEADFEASRDRTNYDYS